MNAHEPVTLRMEEALRGASVEDLRRMLATAQSRANDVRREPCERESYAALADVYRRELTVRSATRLPWLGKAHRELMRSVAA